MQEYDDTTPLLMNVAGGASSSRLSEESRAKAAARVHALAVGYDGRVESTPVTYEEQWKALNALHNPPTAEQIISYRRNTDSYKKEKYADYVYLSEELGRTAKCSSSVDEDIARLMKKGTVAAVRRGLTRMFSRTRDGGHGL